MIQEFKRKVRNLLVSHNSCCLIIVTHTLIIEAHLHAQYFLNALVIDSKLAQISDNHSYNIKCEILSRCACTTLTSADGLVSFKKLE